MQIVGVAMPFCVIEIITELNKNIKNINFFCFQAYKHGFWINEFLNLLISSNILIFFQYKKWVAQNTRSIEFLKLWDLY